MFLVWLEKIILNAIDYKANIMFIIRENQLYANDYSTNHYKSSSNFSLKKINKFQ
jgi:hypothetical protein